MNFLGQLQVYQCSYITEVPEGEERKQEIKNIFEKMAENFPNLVKGNRYTGPRSTQSPKQDEPKEAHIKTHQN